MQTASEHRVKWPIRFLRERQRLSQASKLFCREMDNMLARRRLPLLELAANCDKNRPRLDFRRVNQQPGSGRPVYRPTGEM